MPDFHWLRFDVEPEEAEALASALFDAGAEGVEEEMPPPAEAPPAARALDPAYLPLPETRGLKAFFRTLPEFRAACETFSGRPGFAAGSEADRDWDRSWREQQQPVAVTSRLQVVPPWLEAPAGAEKVIRLEAKRAFGTGSHETTRLCAELLEKMPLEGLRVLDIGTGTGILALYARLLGAAATFAFDIDPVTAGCLHENLALNPGPARLGVFVGTTAAIKSGLRFDLGLCNMIRTELWPFRAFLAESLAPGGRLILSGQLLSDRDHFLPFLREAGLDFEEERTLGEWWGFRAVRTPAGKSPSRNPAPDPLSPPSLDVPEAP